MPLISFEIVNIYAKFPDAYLSEVFTGLTWVVNLIRSLSVWNERPCTKKSTLTLTETSSLSKIKSHLLQTFETSQIWSKILMIWSSSDSKFLKEDFNWASYTFHANYTKKKSVPRGRPRRIIQPRVPEFLAPIGLRDSRRTGSPIDAVVLEPPYWYRASGFRLFRGRRWSASLIELLDTRIAKRSDSLFRISVIVYVGHLIVPRFNSSSNWSERHYLFWMFVEETRNGSSRSFWQF